MRDSTNKTRLQIGLTLLAVLASAPALGYVGPGAGLTLLSALWGLVVAVLAALAFLVLWPLRRWRRRRQALESGSEMQEAVPDDGAHAQVEGRAAMDRRSRQGADASE